MLKWKKTADLNSKTFFKSWSYFVLALAMGAMMFFGVCHPEGDRMWMPEGTAASVDGIDVSSMEFRRAHVAMSEQMRQQYGEKFDPIAMNMSEQVMESLVNSLVIYSEAVKNGIYASDEEVEKVLLEVDFFKGEDGKFDPARLENYLRSRGHTEKSFTEELRRNLVANKFRNVVTNSYRSSEKLAEISYRLDQTKLNVDYVKMDPNSIAVNVDAAQIDKFLKEGGEAKVKDYYEKNKNEYEQDRKVKARHVLIAFKGSRAASGEGAARTKEQAKALAEKIVGEAKAPGADFSKLAEKYTDEASGKTRGGDLGYFRKEQMVKEFADVAFAMQPGQISSVVETPFGFHIIRVDAVQEPKSVSLENAKNEIAEKLIAREQKPQLLESKVKATMADLKAGKAQDLQWKETGEFPLTARAIPGGLGPDPGVRTAILALKKPGDLAPEPLNVGGTYYIVRLKSRSEADLSKLDPKKKEELVDSSRYMEGYTLFSALVSDVRQKYEKNNKIYKNPDFVQYDAKLKTQNSPDAS